MLTSESSYKNDKPMTDTKAIIHFSIILYELVYNMIATKIVTKIAPALMGMSKSIFKAIAPPKISASEVEIEASIAEEIRIFENRGFIWIAAASERHNPVAIPKWATLCCNKINIIVDNVTIQSKLYPYVAPAARFEAQFPGSINPTVTSNPGPINLKMSKPPYLGL
jgi:hypothetical protein